MTMTKEDAKSKTLELAKEMFARVEGKIDKALNSGCIDLESYDGEYILPRIILNAVLQDCVYDTTPPLKKWQKEANNIYKFL